jgi:site-specific recombinase XerD
MQAGQCSDCGAAELHAKGRCTPCYWKAFRRARKQPCPGCGNPGILRADEGGVCGRCARRARPRKLPAPRECRGCGRLALHGGLGLCNACYQRDPARVITWVTGALDRLGSDAPGWFAALGADLHKRCAAPVAKDHLRRVERALRDGHREPAEVVAALRVSGRSPGATARIVDEFFARTGRGSHLDHHAQATRARRQRRLDRVPARMRPAVEAFAEHMLASAARASLLGSGGLADSTIEARIADLAFLAEHLRDRGIDDWSAVTTADLEPFITRNTGSRLASCRAFFRFARRRKLILIDPAAPLRHKTPRGFAGKVLSRTEQQQLIRRWMNSALDPRERVVGLLSLIHGASCDELRHLRADHVDLADASVALRRRPHRVPLDPITASALQDLLATRANLVTGNHHLLITKDNRCHAAPCSPYWMTHILDPAGVRPAVLRQTRLANLSHDLDPRLVSAAFGMTEGGALHYVTDAVDAEAAMFPADGESAAAGTRNKELARG